MLTLAVSGICWGTRGSPPGVVGVAACTRLRGRALGVHSAANACCKGTERLPRVASSCVTELLIDWMEVWMAGWGWCGVPFGFIGTTLLGPLRIDCGMTGGWWAWLGWLVADVDGGRNVGRCSVLGCDVGRTAGMACWLTVSAVSLFWPVMIGFTEGM